MGNVNPDSFLQGTAFDATLYLVPLSRCIANEIGVLARRGVLYGLCNSLQRDKSIGGVCNHTDVYHIPGAIKMFPAPSFFPPSKCDRNQ